MTGRSFLESNAMSIVTIGIGLAVMLFGLYMAVARVRKPEILCKREALQELFGNDMGNLIHLGTYVIIPLIAGAVFIVSGMQGISILF